jgi:hypothetical protein
MRTRRHSCSISWRQSEVETITKSGIRRWSADMTLEEQVGAARVNEFETLCCII